MTVIYTDRDVSPHFLESSVAVKALDPTLYPHTYRMAVFAVREANAAGIDTIRVVGASCHLWRCLRDLRWAAQDRGVTLKLIPHPVTDCTFDRSAETWFTRAAWLWWPCELAYRIVSSLLPAVYKRLRS